jgi:hypothetical protein
MVGLPGKERERDHSKGDEREMRVLLQEQQRYVFVLSSSSSLLLIIVLCCCELFQEVASALTTLLLSDLPTPAFLIHIDFVLQQQPQQQQQQQQQRRSRHGKHHHDPMTSISPILLPTTRQLLVPFQIDGVTCPLDVRQLCNDNDTDADDDDDDDDDIVNCAGTCTHAIGTHPWFALG